jgi:hypothetical protein
VLFLEILILLFEIFRLFVVKSLDDLSYIDEIV